jgi:endonuclease/exonuclease/phosphatase family metal-dependent hydrolase
MEPSLSAPSPSVVASPPPSPPAWLTLPEAGRNLLNLALPGRRYCDNQDPYRDTRLAVESLETLSGYAPAERVHVPELGEVARFERPVLHAVLRVRQGPRLHALVAHLKSKRPKFLQDAEGRPVEDQDDPVVTVRATLRSLVMRVAEAAALRGIVVRLTQRTREPVVLLGDLNDSPHAVTSQMIAATQAVAYSPVNQGWPELLDQIWVSEEFVAASRVALGDVRRVDVFNDHLHESRERWRSDHGFVRALLRLRTEAVVGG